MTDIILPIQAKLASQRAELGLTQEIIGKQAGITQTYLSKVEKGKVDVRLSTLMDIAQALKLELMLVPVDLAPTVQALLGDKNPPSDRPLFEIEAD